MPSKGICLVVGWKEFSNELANFYEQPCNASYFIQLTNLKQLRSVVENNVEHLRLAIQAPEVTPYQRPQLYIDGRSDPIQHDHFLEPCIVRKALQ